MSPRLCRAVGQLQASLSEGENCRFSSWCQEGQGAIWSRELQGLAGAARHGAMRASPAPPWGKDGNPTNLSLWEHTLKENTCFLKGCPIRQVDLILLFPVRTVRKDPIVDTAVLFTACTTMGVLQGRACWPQQNEQPLTYTKACTRTFTAPDYGDQIIS